MWPFLVVGAVACKAASCWWLLAFAGVDGAACCSALLSFVWVSLGQFTAAISGASPEQYGERRERERERGKRSVSIVYTVT